MEARRRSDGHNEPQMQVVGFHVEGQSPSPSPASLLQDSLRTISTGSPTPVIIPPQFQREPGSTRQGEVSAHRSLGPELAASTQPGSNVANVPNVLRISASTVKAPVLPISPGFAASVALAGPPPPAAAVELATQQQAAAAALAAAAASAANNSNVPASSSSAASHTAETAAPAQPHRQQQQQQQQQQQSSSRAALPTAAASAAGPAVPTAPQPAAAAAAAESKEERKKASAPPGDKPPPKAPKPASKAERRALQEAQRAAKAAAKGAEPGASTPSSKTSTAAAADGAVAMAAASSSSGKPPKIPGSQPSGAAAGQGSSSNSDTTGAGAGRGAVPASSTASGAAGARSRAAGGAPKARGPLSTNSTELFAHLQQYRPVSVEGVLRSKEGGSVHPAVLALGLKYADGSITGSTARCVAMIHALSQVIADYHTPEGKSLTRDLMGAINASVDFLVRCRPLSVSMGNAIKALKLYLSKIDPAAPETAAKSLLLSQMQDWLNEKVALADKVLVEHAVSKVYDGDVILTYAYSQVVLEVLLSAAREGKRFRVLVVDSRPELEGRRMMQRLLQADIPCSYAFLSGLSYCMREVTKVLLGAAAILSNGTVLSRAGSAAVAMSAAASSKPVLVCCEAFKFHERVQLDSITHNELGDPHVLAHLPVYAAAPGTPQDPEKGAQSQYLAHWRDIPWLALLNLKYDAMPSEYVSMVVTEFGMIPPSSVPVILREFSESAQME